ncbi:GLABROUS1 enhancer-binding protein family [Arabidopsis thaliana x Arabidopsis arenosa]|uniref:GLABROUS1 enhancer-binding protein family n=1 Tax=Arabidopsis thaliana x Arabidopsis arenosa TaxID=1240361 RepID=A0A8T2B4A9_9BRAS|nr:GLABROUS1 enhancer-binding protein family [Arabidopsis thaliana x Arabidopsis arenosa]
MASSSDEDEVETPIREESEDSSSDEEDDVVSSKNPSSAVMKKPVVATEKQVSDSESGSESDEEETDSGSEEPVKIDEVVTKPVTEAKDSVLMKNQDSKNTVKNSEKSVSKRSRETNEAAASTDVKRVKKVSGEDEKKSGGGEETKKAYFQRVWTEDDEIAVLQGLIDFRNDTGVSPYDDTNRVYEVLKNSISFDVSKVQFMEKLRNLRKKYENNLVKAKNGDEPTFVKNHDRKAFELSKFFWGAIESAVKSSGKSKKSSKSKKVESVNHELDSSLSNGKNEADIDMFPKSSLVRSLVCFGVDEFAAQQGLSCLASEDKKRFEEQWKALQVREFEFYSQKSGFLHEVVAKMGETFRSNA